MSPNAITKHTEIDLTAIDRAVKLQPSTKAKYKREIQVMYNAGVNPANFKELQAYADGLRSSRKQFLKSALRLMTKDYEQNVKAGATPGNLKQTQAALYRLDAMRCAIEVQVHKGKKAHTWLSQKQVAEITALCSDSLEGKRDWIVLGLLLGAGLRREELATLTFDALKQQQSPRLIAQRRGKSVAEILQRREAKDTSEAAAGA